MPKEDKDNYASDFANLVQQATQPHGGEPPPMHPKVSPLKFSDTPEERHNAAMQEQQSLWTLPPGERSYHYDRFDLSDDDQKAKLEEVINNCLRPEPDEDGSQWTLFREFWSESKDGKHMYVVVKYEIRTPSSEQKKDDDRGKK